MGVLTQALDPSCGAPELDTDVLNDLCYQYKYDSRNRLIEKKIPGKGWESIVYDKLDRPVLTQDANLKVQNQWLFTKYDVFGRVAYTGLASTSYNSRTYLQQGIHTMTTPSVSRTDSPQTLAGTPLYYQDISYPNLSISALHTLNYFDSYPPLPAELTAPTEVFDQSVTTRTQGLSTLSKVRVLDTDQWRTTVHYYDEKARPIYTHTKNEALNTTDIVEYKLDFTGTILERKTTHTKDNKAPIITTDRYTYDPMGRLLAHKQQINDQAEELIVYNTYDALGQLESKKVGGAVAAQTENSEGLQTVNYTYNIRGWLKSINEDTNSDNDLFDFSLTYNQPTSGVALYNGNISQTRWKTDNDQFARHYSYRYDDLNRITAAYYHVWSENGRFHLGSLSYDKNGNLQRLYRTGAIVDNPDVKNASHYGTMDYLNYTYDGNQLQKVTDTGNKNYGFKDGSNTDNDYAYDANGNMTEDKNKGIANIEYNHLNLPTEVQFGTTDKISYLYEATGKKLEKNVMENQTTITTQYAGNVIYQNDVLQFFHTPEGYAAPKNASDLSQGFDYVYQYKDHLGNVRLSYTKNPGFDGSSDTTEQLFFDTLETSSGWDSEGALYGRSATIATDKYHSGSTSAKIANTANNQYHYAHSNTWVNIDNTTDTEYTFSGWFYTDAPHVRLVLFMKTDEETGYYTKVHDTGVIKDQKNQWVYVARKTIVPQEIDQINLRIETHGGNAGAAWFDDLKIERKGAAKTVIVQENNYYPFGLEHKGYNNVVNGTEHKWKYQGKEHEEELGLNTYDFGARNYMPDLGRWTTIDPLAEDFVNYTPYNSMMNNPVMFIDPDGRAAMAPIYDPDGNLLGTDDQGLQGKAIVMDKKDFKQGMSHDDALAKNKGAEGLNGKEAESKLVDSYNGLKDRPDYDGKITLGEANEWFRNGEGSPLYVDSAKIDLSPVETSDFGDKDSMYYNFFTDGQGDSTTGRVYGTIKLSLTDENGTVKLGGNNGHLDTYDFDIKENKSNNFKTGLRNFGTRVGRALAGKGTAYKIYTYSTGTVEKSKKK